MGRSAAGDLPALMKTGRATINEPTPMTKDSESSKQAGRRARAQRENQRRHDHMNDELDGDYHLVRHANRNNRRIR